MSHYVYAISEGHVGTAPGVYIERGTVWPADDTTVVAFPSFFSTEPPADMVRRSSRVFNRAGQANVEAATAAPGERRTPTVK